MRGMDYVLFTKTSSGWEVLTGTETVPSAEAGVLKLDAKNSGWHDFVASQGSGRQGVIESTFTWNGTLYIMKEQKEVSY
jgi:hypothetical protein